MKDECRKDFLGSFDENYDAGDDYKNARTNLAAKRAEKKAEISKPKKKVKKKHKYDDDILYYLLKVDCDIYFFIFF